MGLVQLQPGVQVAFSVNVAVGGTANTDKHITANHDDNNCSADRLFANINQDLSANFEKVTEFLSSSLSSMHRVSGGNNHHHHHHQASLVNGDHGPVAAQGHASNGFASSLPSASASSAEGVTKALRPTEGQPTSRPPLVWDWPLEHEDRKKERKADMARHGSLPFEVDRRLLKDVVREKMGVEAGRIHFLSAGTFHKAYLVTLVDHTQLVARVARRFMPRLKTESEVATMSYLRRNTSVPVPMVYHYDSNPYNRLGGEFILMTKAPGVPLAQVYHTLSYSELLRLLKNLAAIVIPLFAHRFDSIGSLYFGPDPQQTGAGTSGAPTPKAAHQDHYTTFPFCPTLLSRAPSGSGPSAGLTPKPSSFAVPTLSSLNPASLPTVLDPPNKFHVGPIISWPFFGSNRGELHHPTELNRGPWSTTDTYLSSCADREIRGVILENEGKTAPHKLHLDPDEIKTSRYHRLRKVAGDESDDSDEWGLSESEDEGEGPGDAMYRDYRRNQRSTFLVKQLGEREEKVRKEMGRWMGMMDRLGEAMKSGKQDVVGADKKEQFTWDCHDLSLENVFVDETDRTKITCIIDWESTTIRPLWAAAHLPAFLGSSPFVSKLFRQVVAQLPSDPEFSERVASQLPASFTSQSSASSSLASLCSEWLYYESAGMRLRMAHRCAEWDGWEEGLVEGILGAEEFESEWFKDEDEEDPDCPEDQELQEDSPTLVSDESEKLTANGNAIAQARKISSKIPSMFANEQEKDQMLNTTGDICGGRGGELGRRLEAWLEVSGGEVRGRSTAWDVDEVGLYDRC